MKDVRAGDVLHLERRAVAVDPLAEYQEIGVRSFGRGIFHKEPLLGADLGNKRVFWIHPGDLIFNNVFAWEGAVALAGPAEKRKIGSHRFMTYVADSTVADSQYLNYFFRSERGLQLLRHASPGSAGRNRTLAIDRFAELRISLPALEEQLRAVARLNEITEMTGKVKFLASSSLWKATALVSSALGGWLADLRWSKARLEDHGLVRRGRGPTYATDTNYWAVNQACVRWEGLDLARAKEVDPLWVESLPESALIQPGDILVNSTGEGTIGRACVVADDTPALPFDSHVLVVRTDPDELLPGFLAMYLRSPQGQAAIEGAKSAKTTKQTELGKRKLQKLPIPLPNLSVQQELLLEYRRLQVQSSRLVALRRASITATEALEPSCLKHFIG